MTQEKRSILDLTIDDLNETIRTGKWPLNLSIDNIHNHPRGKKLITLLDRPSQAARLLIDTKALDIKSKAPKIIIPKEPKIRQKQVIEYMGTSESVKLRKIELERDKITLQKLKFGKQTELFKIVKGQNKIINDTFRTINKLNENVTYLKKHVLNLTNVLETLIRSNKKGGEKQ